MNMRKSTRVLGLMLLGAAGFWSPDLVLHAVRGHNFASRDVHIVTVVMPLTFLGTFVAARRSNKAGRIGLPMVAGIWLLGGLFMAISASFSGGGFVGPDGYRGAAFVVLLSLVPIYTFMLAAYDGSLFALVLVTGISLLVWILQLSKMLWRFSREAHRLELP